MTDDRMALMDLMQKAGDGDFLRSVAEAVLQMLMEADVDGMIGASRHEPSITSGAPSGRGSLSAPPVAHDYHRQGRPPPPARWTRGGGLVARGNRARRAPLRS